MGVALNYNRRIGDVACAWRVSYSPRGPAFGIWGIIYVYTVASFVLQIMHGYTMPTYMAQPQPNYLMGAAWFFTGLWGVTFGRGAEQDQPGFIGLAAFILVATALLAVTAVSLEQSYRSNDYAHVFGVGVPYSLFAGWLCVAAAVNVGIAYMAATTPPDPRCTAGRYRAYNQLVDEDGRSERPVYDSWVPLLLSIAVSAGSFLFPDPVFVAPAFVGIFFMRRTLKNVVALEILVVTCVASSVQVATERWVIKEVV